MPSNLLTADTSFPNLTDDQSTDDKFSKITNYLYMLLEQLRYSLSNLGISNFNDSELEELANIITEPIYIQLSDVEGNISSLYIEADNLTSRIQDAEGNISTLQQTSTSLMSQITSLNGDVSTLQQTATSLTSRITDAEGNISSIQQTVTGITSTIQDINGNISSIQQTVGSITSTVSGLSGDVDDLNGDVSTLTQSVSTIRQTVNSITLSVSNGQTSSTITMYRNGIAVASDTITFNGMVTFSDLSTSGQTTINGGNITTGTISGVTLRSLSGEDSGFQVCYGYRNNYDIVGGIRYDASGAGTETEARQRMFIYTNYGWALKLESGSSASFEANGILYLRGSTACTISSGSGMLDLRGQVYINSESLDSYILGVVG